jgi:hypothetical protein
MLYGDIRATLGEAPQDDLTFFAIRWKRGTANPAKNEDKEEDGGDALSAASDLGQIQS